MTGRNTLRYLSAIIFICTPALMEAQLVKARNGHDIYEQGCAGCHGPDGKGMPDTTVGFEKPKTFPDFTACGQTTPEDNVVWRSIIREGGPARAFSTIMPAFGDALSPDQIDEVIGYLRGFCKAKGWPRGELNLPRPLATEKAFPENEDVVTTAVNVHGQPGVSNEIVFEMRLGAKNQIEVAAPVDFIRARPGVWYGGVGDIGVGFKRELFSSLRTGSILSVFGEVALPTGNRAHGLGSGVTTFSTFAAYGQLLPGKSFVQMQLGADLPRDTSVAPRALFFRTAAGRSFHENGGAGRMWTPMVEFLADRDFQTGAVTNWDVAPEFQVTLSRRQHTRAALGLRIPATNTAGRAVQLMFYFLWDRQDGGLLEGWR